MEFWFSIITVIKAATTERNENETGMERNREYLGGISSHDGLDRDIPNT